jgi:rod shape-determining protein MreB
MYQKKVLNIGIDLGTSRSVIACDNGIRTFVPSFVGYPKDAVARRMFNKDIIFGDDVITHRLSLNVVRPFDKGMLKIAHDLDDKSRDYQSAMRAAKELLNHLVDMAVEGEPEGRKGFILRGVMGAPAMADRRNKKALLEIIGSVFDDYMVVSEPFAVAYGLNLVNNFMIVDIGAGTTDLCRMHGTIPTEEDQVTSTKAGDYVDEVFFDLLKKKYPDSNYTVNMVKRFKEENSTVSARGDSVTIELPVKGKPVKFDVTEELRLACRAIVPDIVEGIRKLVASFDPEFQRELKYNVVLAGGGSQIVGLKKEVEDYMKETLGSGRVIRVEEPLFAGANGALMLCKDMPDEYWAEVRSKAGRV